MPNEVKRPESIEYQVQLYRRLMSEGDSSFFVRSFLRIHDSDWLAQRDSKARAGEVA